MSFLQNQPLSPHHLMKVSFSIDFLRSDFTKLEKKNKRRVLNLSEPHFVYYRPKIIQSSMIIPDEEFEIIWSFLVDRYRILDPKLVYYSGNDGFSLKTVLNKCEGKKPTLVLIKTNKNAVFGAFVSEEWNKDPFKYFGNSESFVFSLHPNEAKYGWQKGNPTYFAMLTETTLSFGHGNGCAIWLDSELLNGRTEHCDTFKNEPLHGEQNTSFQCAAIEIYTFK